MQLLGTIRARSTLLSLLLVALLWRVFLALRFYGWEEDDYGNIARSLSVANGGDLSVSHLPLYYLVNAALIRVFGHADIVCVGVSMACGLLAMGLAMDLARRAGGAKAELVVGLILLVQAEFALYSATSLREPMYAALGLLGIWLLLKKRPVLAGAAMAATLLVRADAVIAFWPGFLLLAFPRRRYDMRGFIGGVACLVAVVVGWSLWSKPLTGSYLFFAPQLDANLTFGGRDGELPLLDFVIRGAKISLGLLTVVLPSKVGWPLLIGALWSVVLVVSRQMWGRPVIFATIFFVLSMVFWLGSGFAFQHGLEHNLYWKWLYVTVPLLTISATFGLLDLADRIGAQRAWLRWGLIGGSLAWFAVCAASDTLFQIRRADELYRPQIELARWIEDTVPAKTAIIIDLVPSNHLNRRKHDFKLLSWYDIDEQFPTGTRDEFDRILEIEQVEYVMWFKEGWTMAPLVAPFLDEPVVVELLTHRLTPMQWNDAYGWSWWKVERIKLSLSEPPDEALPEPTYEIKVAEEPEERDEPDTPLTDDPPP